MSAFAFQALFIMVSGELVTTLRVDSVVYYRV